VGRASKTIFSSLSNNVVSTQVFFRLFQTVGAATWNFVDGSVFPWCTAHWVHSWLTLASHGPRQKGLFEDRVYDKRKYSIRQERGGNKRREGWVWWRLRLAFSTRGHVRVTSSRMCLHQRQRRAVELSSPMMNKSTRNESHTPDVHVSSRLPPDGVVLRHDLQDVTTTERQSGV